MIVKLYELEQKVDKLEDIINKLTVFTNALAQLMVNNDVCEPEEIIEAISEKIEQRPNAQ